MTPVGSLFRCGFLSWTLLGASLCGVQEVDAAAAQDAEHQDSPAAEGHTEALTPKQILETVYGHLNSHAYSEEPFLTLPVPFLGPIRFVFSNHHVAILLAATLVFLLFGWLAWRRRIDPVPRGPLQNLLELGVLFVRDQMIYPTLGKEVGRKLAPLFLTQFFCILLMNLFGILPDFEPLFEMVGLGHGIHFPTTATANIWVTMGLALTTLTSILFLGMREQGVIAYWKNLVPHIDLGTSLGMRLIKVMVIGILIPIELLTLIIRPTALTIRLCANMTGGHLAMLTIYGLIYVFASYPLAGVGVAFNVFVTFLELLVALVQAYIFTYLSIVFVGAAMHPEH